MRTTKGRQWALFFILILLACTSTYIQADENEPADALKSKEIVRTFNVDKNKDHLQIENRYGNITITTWNENKVNVRVVVESKARNVQRAQEAIDRVTINMDQKNGNVHASTSIASNNNNNGRESLTINYYISAPAELALKLDQRYGNIYLPKMNQGVCDLVVKYGNIEGGNFTNDLKIDAGYSNVSIGNGKKIKMNLSYSGNAKFEDADEVVIDAKYSGIKAGNVKTFRVNKSYTNLSAKEINTFILDTKYGGVTIEQLNDEMKVGTLSYSNLTVKRVSASFKDISVSTSYGSLDLSIPKQTAFTIEANNMKYGSFKMNNFNTTHTHVEAPRYYKYEVNNGGKANIKFNGNNYGNIKVHAL